MRRYLALFVLVLVLPCSAYGFTWPVKDSDPNHPQPSVVMAYGDYGEEKGLSYFHTGIDIPSRGWDPDGPTAHSGTAILAMFDMSVIDWFVTEPMYREKGLTLMITPDFYTFWMYSHIWGKWVMYQAGNEGDSIGVIAYYPEFGHNAEDHVHLTYSSMTRKAIGNPLIRFPVEHRDPGGQLPFIWEDDDFAERVGYRQQEDGCWSPGDCVRWAYQPGSHPAFAPRIEGEVDIVVKAQDYMNGRFRGGVGQLGDRHALLNFWFYRRLNFQLSRFDPSTM